MDKRKFNKRKCNVCSSTDVKIWSENKWWCKITSEEGYMNMVGFCPKQKKEKKNERST